MTPVLIPAASAAGNEREHANYIVSVFNEENGLPTGEANAVLQTKNGYIWIGSYGGLIRYDGSAFVDFSDRLSSSAVRALYESRDGTLYIGTNDAGAFSFRNDVFTSLLTEDSDSYLCVRAFAENDDGTVYAASTSGAVKLGETSAEPFLFSELQGAQLKGIAVDGSGNIWALSDAGELFVFNEDEFITKISSSELFDTGFVNAVVNDREGNVFAGSSDGGEIIKLSAENGTTAGDLGSCAKEKYSAGDIGSINELKIVSDGRVLVSALNGFGFLDANGTFQRVDRDAENILSANKAELDHEGNFWVASSHYGIVRYSVGCFDSCNNNSSLGDYTINAVARQGKDFYVGTDSGLMLFDEDWNQKENALTALLSGVRIRNITVDTSGRVWMATYSSHGAMCYDPATGKTTDFGEAQGLNSEKVRVVYGLSDGRMLVGSQLGVNIIENGVITESYSAEDGLSTTSVLCAMELDGRIYVGTDGSGIYEITGSGLKNLGFSEGLSQGVVLRLTPDSDGNGNYFVCAGDKLFYCEKDSFRPLTSLVKGSGSIYSVYDVGGRIWLLQNAGVFAAEKSGALSEESVYTAHYGVKCGLTGTLSANTWNWLDEDGSLYLSTRKGVSLFHFKGSDVVMPRAILNSVTVDDECYEHPEALTLPSGARRVTMDISELLFSDTAEFMIGYRLEGFDTEETVTAEKHVSVSYTNLKGGSYTLQIRVIDPLSGESTDVQEISIVKQKRLTEQLWFMIACAALGMMLAAATVILIMRRKTKKLLKKQEEQRRYIDDITKVFSQCVDMRDAYTNGHSSRVAKYTALLASELGKSDSEVWKTYQAALLHDVGKISIPDAVLNKPSQLTDEEYAVMKSHAQRGAEVLGNIEIETGLAEGAGAHHERFDGRGYPKGLKGEEIPEVARIIAVADTFDAMYSTRPYRKKMELGTVVEEIKKGSGTQFSPDVVDAFMRLYQKGAFDNE